MTPGLKALNARLQAPAEGRQPSSRTQRSEDEKRTNYYTDLAADYSRPGLVAESLQNEFLALSLKINAMQEKSPPVIGDDYTMSQVEQENKEWWPTHCEALRQGRGDILTGEYRPDLVYFCQDGAYYGIEEQKVREQHWWALIAQPGATMTWPIVMFHGEYVWFEWSCIDDDTNETLAKGSCVWVRRGHRGGCNFKGEQLTFYRDVFSSPELLELITRS